MNSSAERCSARADWFVNEYAAGRIIFTLPPFRYDKTRKISPNVSYYRDRRVNTICLNLNERKIVEFDSVKETCNWFNLTPDTIRRPFFQARDGILWIVLRGDIGEEARAWFDDADTLFSNAINNLPEKYRTQVTELLKTGENKTKYGPNPKIPTIAVNLTRRTIMRFSCINDTARHFKVCVSNKTFFKTSNGDYWSIIRGDKTQFDENSTTEEIISAAMENLSPDQQKFLTS
ncbi:hypothetical protein ACJMK2_002613 [Sinanodonta woodiana]|uniref:Uncharacterized protein n=1 Tax=Sinanodonta woodiana TaxID=1069815 RepID=A0ABD3XY16_SINWO